MKLYIEHQVREILKKAFWQDLNDGDTEESLISELTSIELLSDEEIEEKSFGFSDWPKERVSFLYGAKWMRDKIQGGSK